MHAFGIESALTRAESADLPVPAGFAVDLAGFDALVRDGTIGKYQVTPRQVIVYLRGLRPGQAVTLKYALRATLPARNIPTSGMTRSASSRQISPNSRA